MARRRKTNAFEDLIFIASRLPWWVSLLIAFAAWLILHPIAISKPPVVTTPQQMGEMAIGQMGRSLAMFGQYLLPLAFIFGAIGSVFARIKRKNLAANVANARETGQTIDGISWCDFELLVSETFRRKGFTVIEKGGSGPDGGVDLVLHLGTDKYLVQCKQWKAINVGVTVIREFFGVMAAQGAAGGFVVTSGRYTAEAKAFADGRNIQLVDGSLLKRWIANHPPIMAPAPVDTKLSPEVPLCPFCNTAMTIRTAKRGSNVGGEFWGCVNFPVCRGVRKIV
ncbi:restriction endonuclease [Pseudomonas nitroreducens]|uniref:Restriction endonuclease n=1 Tax=Pseudomonas nitroreducens TaxID=46680 RepID=A0ABS0KJZ5_PSENT|nr:restriction endonuclease [Pseudomonas nitroreducens]MBG6288401.1 restriction endonuclease [Pseudomonas nitroreducens]